MEEPVGVARGVRRLVGAIAGRIRSLAIRTVWRSLAEVLVVLQALSELILHRFGAVSGAQDVAWTEDRSGIADCWRRSVNLARPAKEASAPRRSWP